MIKKLFLPLLITGIVFCMPAVKALETHRQMIYTPVVSTYTCTIRNDKCRVTEISYLENGKNYYKSVCTGDRMSASHNESLARKDVERKSRQYCNVEL